jgi:phosphoglycolate phosphatase
MNLKNIIFDFDGVIADSYSLIYKIFSKQNNELTEEIFKSFFEGNTIFTATKYFGKNSELIVRNGLKEYGSRIEEVECFNDVKESLKVLAEKYNLFIISSGPKNIINTFLKQYNLEVFKKVLGREIASSKVKKFKILEDEYFINQDDSIFITDTLGDVIEAHDAGYRVIAETFGFHNKEVIERGKPEHMVNNWQEIMNTLNNIKE